MCGGGISTLLGPQSRCGDKSLGIKLVCPQIGTAVLKGLNRTYGTHKNIYFAIFTTINSSNIWSYVLWRLPINTSATKQERRIKHTHMKALRSRFIVDCCVAEDLRAFSCTCGDIWFSLGLNMDSSVSFEVRMMSRVSVQAVGMSGWGFSGMFSNHAGDMMRERLVTGAQRGGDIPERYCITV